MLRSLGTTSKTISSIKFTSYSSDEIRKLSSKKVTNPHSLDVLSNPTSGGLYDTAFGPSTRDDLCSSCGQGSIHCPGHIGFIEMPLPVYHPLFFKTLICLLRGSCMKCQKIMLPRKTLQLFVTQLEALENGLVHTVFALQEAQNEIKSDNLSDKSIETATLVEIQDHLNDVLLEHYQSIENSKTSFVDKSSVHDEFKNGWSKNAAKLHFQLVNEFLGNLSTRTVRKCLHCGSSVATVRSEHNSRIFITEDSSNKDASQVYLTPSNVRDHIVMLWQNEHSVLSRVFVAMTDAAKRKGGCERTETEKRNTGDSSTTAVDVLFLDALPVPPSRFRPIGCVKDKQFESSQTTNYSKVLMDCLILRHLMRLMKGNMDGVEEGDSESAVKVQMAGKGMDLLSGIPGNTVTDKLENAWHRMQQHVNSLFDSDLDRLAVRGVLKTPGIKQLLEKKEGLFRQNMMGKRVNYAARSVISPDPYIATNEIGLPLVFASKLTYPTPVTPWNVKMLRKVVINGPKVYPGATHVISGSKKILLSSTDKSQREAVAKQLIATDHKEDKDHYQLEEPKVVMRHVQTGDVMLLNRQPTLHRGSMMAHKVRVLPGEKTLRLHYANCKSYNADFDGDEMNAHFPQSEECRAEAYQLMLTDKQYLSAKDGKPLSCLIQDHMVAGVNLCLRGKFFTREEYHLLVYTALMHLPVKVKLLPPSMLKPQKLWSGKQLFSTLLHNIIPERLSLINLTAKSKIGAKCWNNRPSRLPVTAPITPGDMCESQVIIRGGDLLCGVLDKAHYGATEYGLTHAMYELYGGEVSGRLLTCLARLFTAFLQQHQGFTLGVQDILVTPVADDGRSEVIQNTKEGSATVAKTLGLKKKNTLDDVTNALRDAHIASKLPSRKKEDKLAAVDHAMKSVSNSVNNQIAGWCTGDGLIKTFPENNLQLMVISGAKGGMVNCMQISCLLGQIELEGRRPPLMPSGRSVPSFKPYNTTLRAGGFVSQRFLSGIRSEEYFYHCMAGREGLVDTAVKTSRSGYLQRCLIKHLEGLLLSYDMTVRDSDGSVMQFTYGEDGVDVSKSSYLRPDQNKFVVDNFQAISKQHPSMEKISSVFDTSSALRKWGKFEKAKTKRDRKLNKLGGDGFSRNSGFLQMSKSSKHGSVTELKKQWQDLSSEEKKKLISSATKYHLPDPLISQLRPDLYFGVTSELFHEGLRKYLKTNPDHLPGDEDEEKIRSCGKPSLKSLEDLCNLRYQRSLTQPGEGVGLLAAQSIGEPSTQMTLNTFHFAGRGEMNVTLGIPRLREILMVASKQTKTPQMTVPVRPGMVKRARRLCKELTTVRLSQVLHKFTLEERLVVNRNERRRVCDLNIIVLPEVQFIKDLALNRASVLRYIETRFIRSLLSELHTMLKKHSNDPLIIDKPVVSAERQSNPDRAQADDALLEEDLPVSGDIDEDVDANDGDATAEKEKQMTTDDVDYDEPDDGSDEEAADETVVPDISPPEVMAQEDDENGNSDHSAEVMEGIKQRLDYVKKMSHGDIMVEDYDFDTKESGWCKVLLSLPLVSANIDLVSVVRDLASRSAVRKVRGLNRCILVPRQGGDAEADDMNFVTEGINFHRMFDNEDCLDVNRIYCNCVHSVANMYGIEAARRVVVKEIANVFAVYGIEVDRRHLTLIGDYMCYEGLYKPFNRVAMRSCASPLQQMSFETTMKFLNNAALFGSSDILQSPSARIVAGQVVQGGTGCHFSLVYPVSDLA